MASKKDTPRRSNGSDLLTRQEAAEYLGVTAETLAVWKCLQRYDLPVVKVGRLAKYRRTDLDKFLRDRTIESKPSDGQSEPQAAKSDKTSRHGVEFAQVRLVGSQQRRDAPARANNDAMEVVLPSGITLRLPPGCSLELLSSVVALLENR